MPHSADSAQCVVVLGMHRSGTSMLAGSLECAGLYLGDISSAARFNKKGNKENSDIRAQNDRILARAGATWGQPPPLQAPWSQEDRDDATELVRSYIDVNRPWGFKDPRTVWTLQGWLDILPNPTIVAVVRHPALVAKSLTARAGSLRLSYEAGLSLWAAYNTEILRLVRLLQFPVLHFSSGKDPMLWKKLEQICQDIGLAASPRAFYAAGLVNQREVTAVPDAVSALYKELCGLAQTPLREG